METFSSSLQRKGINSNGMMLKRISFIPIEKRNATNCTNVLNFLLVSVVLPSSCNGLIYPHNTFPSIDPLIYICHLFNMDLTSIKWSNRSKMTKFHKYFIIFVNLFVFVRRRGFNICLYICLQQVCKNLMFYKIVLLDTSFRNGTIQIKLKF